MGTLSLLVKFAQAHGFTSYITGDHVTIEIPWYNVKTDEQGIDKEKAKNIKQLKEVLGY